jgi:hypothetical protein
VFDFPQGTFRYMSRNVLDATGPHTYLDDLESFYYVFCYILGAYERPGTGKAELPRLLSLWDHPGASDFKEGLFNQDFQLPVAPWFGESLHQLAIRLHRFFDFRYKSVGKPLSSLNSAKDYDEFLSHILQGLADLEKEFEPANDTSPLPRHPSEASEVAEPTSRNRAHGRGGNQQSELEPTDEALHVSRHRPSGARESAKPASGIEGHRKDSDKQPETGPTKNSSFVPTHRPSTSLHPAKPASGKRGRGVAAEESAASKRPRRGVGNHGD